MRQKYLIVEPELLTGGAVIFKGELAHYMHSVMRLTKDDVITLSDGVGCLCEARITASSHKRVETELLRKELAERPPGAEIVLLFGLTKASSTTVILQKAAELGVTHCIPTLCERSVGTYQDQLKKQLRWQEIVRGAARQSGRAWLPTVDPPSGFKEALLAVSNKDLGMVAAITGADPATLREPCRKAEHQIAVLVGPEGGLTEKELAEAQAMSFIPTTVSEAVLRSETAVIVAIALISFLSGRLVGGQSEAKRRSRLR